MLTWRKILIETEERMRDSQTVTSPIELGKVESILQIKSFFGSSLLEVKGTLFLRYCTLWWMVIYDVSSKDCRLEWVKEDEDLQKLNDRVLDLKVPVEVKEMEVFLSEHKKATKAIYSKKEPRTLADLSISKPKIDKVIDAKLEKRKEKIQSSIFGKRLGTLQQIPVIRKYEKRDVSESSNLNYSSGSEKRSEKESEQGNIIYTNLKKDSKGKLKDQEEDVKMSEEEEEEKQKKKKMEKKGMKSLKEKIETIEEVAKESPNLSQKKELIKVDKVKELAGEEFVGMDVWQRALFEIKEGQMSNEKFGSWFQALVPWIVNINNVNSNLANKIVNLQKKYNELREENYWLKDQVKSLDNERASLNKEIERLKKDLDPIGMQNIKKNIEEKIQGQIVKGKIINQKIVKNKWWKKRIEKNIKKYKQDETYMIDEDWKQMDWFEKLTYRFNFSDGHQCVKPEEEKKWTKEQRMKFHELKREWRQKRIKELQDQGYSSKDLIYRRFLKGAHQRVIGSRIWYGLDSQYEEDIGMEKSNVGAIRWKTLNRYARWNFGVHRYKPRRQSKQDRIGGNASNN